MILKKIFQRKINTWKYTTRSDYDNTFEIPKKLLVMLTIRMTHKLTPFASKWWNIFAWFEITNICLVLVGEFMSMVETAGGGTFEDATTIFGMIPCFGVTLVALLRIYKLVKCRPVFENLVNEVGDMWPERKLDNEERTIVGNALKQLLYVIKGYYWCNNALFITFILPTNVESIKRLLGFNSVMRTHAYRYWLPFELKKQLYFDILLLIQTWHAFIVIFSNVCGDLLFCTFLSHITTQFDLLSLRIQRLVYVPMDSQLIETYPLGVFGKTYQESGSNVTLHISEWEKIHQEELEQIIRRHQALLRLSEDVESMFSFSMLVTFLNSSVTICLCGFCSVVVEKWNEIAYKSFLVTALSQTFLICWYGQKLLDSSTAMSQAIYNSGWYMASKKIKSSILIMLHRAQKMVSITTYGFSVISLESYSKIIKTAWSYFTILINTYKQ